MEVLPKRPREEALAGASGWSGLLEVFEPLVETLLLCSSSGRAGERDEVGAVGALENDPSIR